MSYSATEAKLLNDLAASQALCAELQTKLESALATVRLLESTPAMDAIAAGLEDVKAGRVKSLTCVQGGCRATELEQSLAEAKAAKEKAWGNEKFVREQLATALKSLQEQEDAAEQAERERDALVVMLRASVSDATFETISVIESVAKYLAMEAELAAIKGRLQWGYLVEWQSLVACHSEASAREYVSFLPEYRTIVSRYQAGPWQPASCQQCGGEGGGWIDGPGSVFVKCALCGGKEPAEPSVEVPE